MLNFDQFNCFKEVKIFSSADRQTGMGSEKEETLWVFSCLTVSQCSLPWRKKASYVSLKGSEAWMVLPSCAIGFFETSRYVIFSRPPLWAAQFCHVPRLWLAVAHQEKHLKVVSLPLQKWVWDFSYFIKCLNDFWVIVVLVSISMTFQCLKTCRGKWRKTQFMQSLIFFFSSVLHFFSKCISWHKGNWSGSVFHLKK